MADEVCHSVPEFLKILWRLVNDPVMNELIHWNEGGDSFTIVSSLDSWKVILKLHYKHNNMSSFIRQLNLYGFKRMHLDKDCVMDDNFMCFYHPCFKKNEVELLRNIKRKNPPKISVSNQCSTELVEELVRKIETLNTESNSINNLLQKMKNENVAIWRELTMLRRSCDKQSEIITSLFHFLLSFVRPTNSSDNYFRSKRRLQLMIEDKKERGKRFRKQRKTSSVRSPEINVLSPDPGDQQQTNFNSDQNLNEIVNDHNQMDIWPKIELLQNEYLKNNDISKFVLHEDVMLTPKDNVIDDDFLQAGTSSNTNTSSIPLNDTKNELSLVLKSPNCNNTTQDNDMDFLTELLKEKGCNMDTNSFLDMFNYNHNLQLDTDFLTHLSNDYEKSIIPYNDANGDEISEILNTN